MSGWHRYRVMLFGKAGSPESTALPLVAWGNTTKTSPAHRSRHSALFQSVRFRPWPPNHPIWQRLAKSPQRESEGLARYVRPRRATHSRVSSKIIQEFVWPCASRTASNRACPPIVPCFYSDPNYHCRSPARDENPPAGGSIDSLSVCSLYDTVFALRTF